jgi:hypothetical protein
MCHDVLFITITTQDSNETKTSLKIGYISFFLQTVNALVAKLRSCDLVVAKNKKRQTLLMTAFDLTNI